MDYINDGLRAKYITDQEYDLASSVKSTLQPGYFITNESLDFISKFDIRDKKVLSVCSSGDHAFMSIVNGAKEVDTFDSNPLQYYVMELKKAAILGLSKNEFLEYIPLCSGDIRVNYNKKYYDKIKVLLNDDVRYFWDQIYSLEKPYIYLLTKFSYNIKFESDYTRYYDELKRRLEYTPINFKLGTLFDIKSLFNEDEYSLIILSNIFDHINRRCESFKEKDYYKFINEEVLPLLKDDGSAIFHYQFGFDKSVKRSDFTNCDTIKCGLGDTVKVLKKK